MPPAPRTGPGGAGRVVGGVFQAAGSPHQSGQLDPALFPRHLLVDLTGAPGGLMASRPEPRSSPPLSSPAWLRSSRHPTRRFRQRNQHLLAGWPGRVGGTRPRGPASGAPRNVRQPTKWSREASLYPQGEQVINKRTDKNKPEAASYVWAKSAKWQQLLQGWSARPSREGDLETENQSGGDARGGGGVCEGPGPGELREADQQDPEAGTGTVREPDRPRRARPPGPRGAGRVIGVT